MIDLLLRQAPEFFTASNLAFLARAAGMTMVLTALGGGIGALCGFAIVLVRTSVSPWLFPVRMLAIAFVELFRRIPFLVVLFLVLFSIQALSPNASLFTIATIAICLVSTAFISEIIRAGFDAIPRQQIEAAATMNVPRWRVVHAIILPQAWTLVVPPAIAFLVMFIKDTALASQMGVVELTFVGKTLANRGFSSFLVFGTVMAIYFAISWPVAAFGRFLEARLATARH